MCYYGKYYLCCLVCYRTGRVTESAILMCYSTSRVAGGAIPMCYSTGHVAGRDIPICAIAPVMLLVVLFLCTIALVGHHHGAMVQCYSNVRW